MSTQTTSSSSCNRRQFMISGLTAGGSLLVGSLSSNLLANSVKDPAFLDTEYFTENSPRIGHFIEIRSDNSIIIGNNQPEIGQGLLTSLPMLIAEELEVNWENISVRQMPLGIVKTQDGFTWQYGGQGVGGSTGLTSNWDFMRQVGATARYLLQQAAAQVWSIDITQTYCKSGHVINSQKNQSLPYAKLVEIAAKLKTPSQEVPLKPLSKHTIVGTQRSQLDIKKVVTGKSQYGIDTLQDNAKIAMIERCPYLDGSVKSFDDSLAKKVAGVIDIFHLEGPKPGAPYHILADGVVVIAENTWAAIKARKALKIKWQKGAHTKESSESFIQQCDQLLKGKGQIVRDDGDFENTLKNAPTVIQRDYFVPFVSHAPLEVQNCFAHVKGEQCKIIVPTQMPSGVSRAVSAATKLARENISIEMTRVGGGFGRRLSVDYAVEAALISQISQLPIKLIWSREDDLQHDFYRPSGKHQLIAGLNKHGKVEAWKHRLASASKYYRRPNVPESDYWKAELYSDDFPAQLVPNFMLEYFSVQSGLPRGSWRAPAHTANAFAIQSFIDEIAHQTKQDPLKLQLAMLGQSQELAYSNHGGPTFNPARLARLLKFVAKEINYSAIRTEGTGVGIACHFTFGGYAAHAIEVNVDSQGQLTINRIVAAIDCGLAVNPDAVKAQLEGGTVDGLSTALNLEITTQLGQVVQSNFDTYPLARLSQIPRDFTAHILPWDDKPTGVGEIPVPPVAPALTNAIFNATGKRIRRLPIGDQLTKNLK